jgi:hypothetical protein
VTPVDIHYDKPAPFLDIPYHKVLVHEIRPYSGDSILMAQILLADSVTRARRAEIAIRGNALLKGISDREKTGNEDYDNNQLYHIKNLPNDFEEIMKGVIDPFSLESWIPLSWVIDPSTQGHGFPLRKAFPILRGPAGGLGSVCICVHQYCQGASWPIFQSPVVFPHP